jgi:hypothetical protein
MEMTFPSKRDWWLVALVAVAGLAGISAMAAAAISKPDEIGYWWLIFVVAVYGFVAWIFFSTKYEITASDLVVRSGPFRWNVPLGGIDEVYPTKNPLSSPALSLDRLMIRYRKRSGRRTAIMISPVDKTEFVRQLAKASPGLVAHTDCAMRTPSMTQAT